MNGFIGKLNFLDRNYSSVVRQRKTLIICSIIKFPFPKINLSLEIESDFAVHVFCRDVEINKIGDYNISKHVTDQKFLEILIKNTKKMETEQQKTEPQNKIFILKLVMLFLRLVQEESINYALLELTKYCIEELKMQYILPGKVQTDHLETRLG